MDPNTCISLPEGYTNPDETVFCCFGGATLEEDELADVSDHIYEVGGEAPQNFSYNGDAIHPRGMAAYLG